MCVSSLYLGVCHGPCIPSTAQFFLTWYVIVGILHAGLVVHSARLSIPRPRLQVFLDKHCLWWCQVVEWTVSGRESAASVQTFKTKYWYLISVFFLIDADLCFSCYLLWYLIYPSVVLNFFRISTPECSLVCWFYLHTQNLTRNK